MTTTLTIDLSTQMQSWLTTGGAGNGVSAYAILYGSTVAGGTADTPVASQTLVSDGTVHGGGSVTLDLTDGTRTALYGGKVYFIIQSADGSITPIDPTTLSQSAINWTNAAALDYRYDSIEVALTGSAGDAANLTSIGGFGIGMALEASTGSRSYAVSASDLFGSLATAPTDPVAGKPAVATFTVGGLAGHDREAISPAVAAVPDNNYPVYSASDWDKYVDALKTAAPHIVISGYFNGAGDLRADAPSGTELIWRNAGFFSYALEWVEKDASFWLSPTEGSQIQGAIKLTAEALANSIYATRATVELHEAVGIGPAFEIYPANATQSATTEMNTGANNAWGQVLQQLTLGLTAGYLESTGTSPNGAVTGGIDLNKNYNWMPTFAFGTDTTSALPSDVAVRFDPFSQLFYQYSNSYGTQYADALMSAYAQGVPQLPTYAGAANVAAMKVTLFADSETPPAGAYTPPVMYNHVPGSAAGGKYEIAQWHDGNASNIALDFNPGNSLAQSLVLKDDVTLSIRILTGYTGDTPKWQELAIGGAGVTPWQNWTFGHDANGKYTLTGNGGAGQTSQSLILTGPPMPDSGVGWYQIVVKSTDFEKTYNLYTTTFTPSGTGAIPQFSNFATDPSLFGIDGLATLIAGAPQPTGGGLLTFSVAVTGVTPTLDLSLMQPNTSAGFLTNPLIPTATAPVAGTIFKGAFVPTAGQTTNVHDGAGNGSPLSVTSHSGAQVFGWTGLNDAADTRTWTQTFTNLVQGKSIAVIDIVQHGGAGHIAPIHVKADLAGGWHTVAAHQFGNGIYDVSMTAYAAKANAPFAPDLATQLAKESAVLTLTVQLNDLALRATGSGTGLELVPDASDTAGNWIRFAANAAGLPDGVAVALYATDAAGNPVGPDGLPVGSIGAAVLGWVGAVGSDKGATLLEGVQSIYLATGLHLHFALADDRGGLAAAGGVRIDDHGDGTVSLDLGGIVLDGEIGNTLSAEMQAAAVQRTHGLPLIHLDQGELVELSLVGSTANTNQLGFVRLDLDHATGAISLGGVAYGDTDTFRDAVRGALDAGFSAAIGGDFAQTLGWVVAGDTGYYAPVLITQSGEVFVPGSANRGGYEYIRTYGANSFGFEDLTYDQASDFDYNDMVMTLRPIPDSAMM